MKTYDFITNKRLGNVYGSSIVVNADAFDLAQSLVNNNQNAISERIDQAMSLQNQPSNVTIGIKDLGDRILSLLNFDIQERTNDTLCTLVQATI